MAISQFTSQEPSATQSITPASTPCHKRFEARLLTVGDYMPTERWRPGSPRPQGGTPTPMPYLRLQGRWLDRAGFARGTRVRVEVAPGRLVIETVPTFPEHEPRLPRKGSFLI